MEKIKVYSNYSKFTIIDLKNPTNKIESFNV